MRWNDQRYTFLRWRRLSTMIDAHAFHVELFRMNRWTTVSFIVYRWLNSIGVTVIETGTRCNNRWSEQKAEMNIVKDEHRCSYSFDSVDSIGEWSAVSVFPCFFDFRVLVEDDSFAITSLLVSVERASSNDMDRGRLRVYSSDEWASLKSASSSIKDFAPQRRS